MSTTFTLFITLQRCTLGGFDIELVYESNVEKLSYGFKANSAETWPVGTHGHLCVGQAPCDLSECQRCCSYAKPECLRESSILSWSVAV